MNINEIFGDVPDLSGGGKRILSISTEDERLVLPVTPWKYQVQIGQNNKIVDVLDFGEALVFGNTKLHRLKFSCFFPDLEHNYGFVVGDKRTPQDCLETLNRWKSVQEPVRVIITDSPVNETFAIMDISFREKDGTRDIEYDIDLVEYREWNIPESNYTKTVNSLTNLKERAGVRSNAALMTFLEFGTRDVMEACKALTGNYSDIGGVLTAAGAITGNASIGQMGSILKDGINLKSAGGIGTALTLAGSVTGSKTISNAGSLASSTGQYMAMGAPAPVAAGLAVISNPKAAVQVLKKANPVSMVTNTWKSVTKTVKKACYITTAVCGSFGKADDCAELTAFRAFRDNWLLKQPDGQRLISEYYDVAPEIVRRIEERADSAEIYRWIWDEYLEPCYELIQRGANLACKRKYVEMVRRLQLEFG